MSARNVVGAYLDAFFKGQPDLDVIRTLLHDDFSFSGPLMTATGADDFIAQLKRMGEMNMRAEIHRLLDDGEHVAALYDFLGPTGKLSFSEWFRVQDDKIVSSKLHYDPRPLLKG